MSKSIVKRKLVSSTTDEKFFAKNKKLGFVDMCKENTSQQVDVVKSGSFFI